MDKKKLQAVKDAQRLHAFLYVMNISDDFQEHLTHAAEIEKYIDKSCKDVDAKGKLQAIKDLHRLQEMLKLKNETMEVQECMDLVFALEKYITKEV